MTLAAPILATENLGISFGGLRALEGVNLSVGAGEILCVIGPNGSGKTTFFNCISGVYTQDEGQVWYQPGTAPRQDISPLALHQRARLGLARTFQTIRLFDGMSVLENVLCGFYAQQKINPLWAVVGGRRLRHEETRLRGEARALLENLDKDLLARENELAASLPYAHRRRLEIARALATRPRLLLLDEPAAGMDHADALLLAQDILRLQQQGLSLIVIEHNMSFIRHLNSTVAVLAQGRVITQGTFEEISNHPQVISAYLGEEQPEDRHA